jgi:FtsP/CotA-like multicopper oxidase with cupredoxin domain
MALNRRDFLHNAARAALFQAVTARLPVLDQAMAAAAKPGIAPRIEPTSQDIGPGVSIRTVAYNGQVPGPTLQLKEGLAVTVDVTNTMPNEDVVHWHGLAIGTIPDGAVEEGSPIIKPGKTLRYSFTPRPAGMR